MYLAILAQDDTNHCITSYRRRSDVMRSNHRYYYVLRVIASCCGSDIFISCTTHTYIASCKYVHAVKTTRFMYLAKSIVCV